MAKILYITDPSKTAYETNTLAALRAAGHVVEAHMDGNMENAGHMVNVAKTAQPPYDAVIVTNLNKLGNTESSIRQIRPNTIAFAHDLQDAMGDKPVLVFEMGLLTDVGEGLPEPMKNRVVLALGEDADQRLLAALDASLKTGQSSSWGDRAAKTSAAKKILVAKFPGRPGEGEVVTALKKQGYDVVPMDVSSSAQAVEAHRLFSDPAQGIDMAVLANLDFWKATKFGDVAATAAQQEFTTAMAGAGKPVIAFLLRGDLRDEIRNANPAIKVVVNQKIGTPLIKLTQEVERSLSQIGKPV